jgi:hypothetical protein
VENGKVDNDMVANGAAENSVVEKGRHPQRQYKNNLFVDYFSDKQRLIEAYNALSGEDFPIDAEVKFETLTNVLYDDIYNDLAFTIEGRYVVLIEHQSTINDNMPLRLLLYIARTYEKIVPGDELYRRQQRKIPAPEFIVVYNGRAPYPDKQEIRLSDAFLVAEQFPALELVATVYNVAKGHSEELLAKSRALFNYTTFVSAVEDYLAAGFPFNEAVTKAIQDCKRRGIMVEYLESRGSEVLNMLLTEWNMEDALRVAREEEREIGERRGEKRATRANATRMKAAGLDVKIIVECTGLAPEEVAQL